MVDRVGQHLGNYYLIRLLGRGGFAEVYLGEHIYLKTPAAVKLLQTKVANQEDLQSFLKEAQTIAQLVHPHIVRVLDFGVDGDTPFLVMDYAMGGTLRQRHPRGTHLPLTTIVPYVKQVAEALQYAHEEKFIHRDVKPENMLVGRRDAVLLSDFGIALIAQSSRYQSTQEVIGTVAYMAPEQIQGKPRPASDEYSLAVVVYEWLTGVRPFQGSFTELCTQHMFASPPPLREKMPMLSAAVEQVVMTALAKDPKQRFASVQAFANALEQASRLKASEAILSSRSSQSPEFPTQLSQSFIPTELITPPTQSSIPTALSSLSSQAPLPPNQLAAPSGQQAFPAKLVFPSTPPTVPADRMIPQNQATWQSSIADRSLDKLHPPQRSISRRLVIAGLAGLAIVGVTGGSLAWLTRSRMSPPAPAVTVTANSTSPSGSAQPITSSGAMFGFDLQRSHMNPAEHTLSPANVSHLVPFWTASTGTYSSYITSSPAVANGVVYVGSDDHTLYAFDVSTGKTLWTAVTGNVIRYSSPAVANGIVYVGSFDGKLYAFNATTGSPLWTAATGNAIGSSPAVTNGVVYVGSHDHKLYAFSVSTGQTFWTASTGDIILSSPAVANGIVYAGSLDGKLYAFNASTGQTFWTATTSDKILSSPAVAKGVVYIGSDDHKLYAFNASTGMSLWTASTGDRIEFSSPAVANGVVYIGSLDHKLYAFDTASGRALWTASTGDLIYSSPTIANGVVYVGSFDGKLYAFDAATGKTLWTAPTSDKIFSSPAIANGVVYVGADSLNGKLFAFHLP